MRSDRALAELKALRDAAATAEVQREGAAQDAWKAKVIVVMRRVLGDKSTTLGRFTNHRFTVGLWTGAPGEAEYDRRYFADQVTLAAGLIDASIYEVELMAEGKSVGIKPVAGTPPVAETVFLVHGHDGAAKHEVARFVERITGKPPVILDEQENRGRTLVEKFEAHANTAAYAIVLATPDDVGRVAGTDPATDQPRARQNVVFELGYFFGKLGRDRVAVLNSGVEKPSDVNGFLYIDYPVGDWQLKLAKELYGAGVSVDMVRLLENVT